MKYAQEHKPSDPASRIAHSEAVARARIKAKEKYFIVYTRKV